MAGIFNLFGKMEDPVRRASNMPEVAGTPRKPGIRLGTPGTTPAKLFESTGIKPKGLSMRSHSDLNIAGLNSKLAANLNDKKQSDITKLSVTQLDVEGKPISPGSKDRFAKVKDSKPLSTRSPPSKQKFRKTNLTSQDNVFKKPQTPTVVKNIKRTLKPEKLAFHYDEREHYFKVDDKNLDSYFKDPMDDLIMALKTCDDEGLESDPEILPCSPIPELKLYKSQTPGKKFEEDSVELPEISDDEF